MAQQKQKESKRITGDKAGGGSAQDQQMPTTIERPEVEGAVKDMNSLIKRTARQREERRGCGCGW